MSELINETVLFNGEKRDIWIVKGKRAVAGEIRTHGKKKMQKQGDGSWKEIKKQKQSMGGKDAPKSPSKLSDSESAKKKKNQINKELDKMHDRMLEIYNVDIKREERRISKLKKVKGAGVRARNKEIEQIEKNIKGLENESRKLDRLYNKKFEEWEVFDKRHLGVDVPYTVRDYDVMHKINSVSKYFNTGNEKLDKVALGYSKKVDKLLPNVEGGFIIDMAFGGEDVSDFIDDFVVMREVYAELLKLERDAKKVINSK